MTLSARTGNNLVATASGFAGLATFVAPKQINVDAGNPQTGVVTFTVAKGGGSIGGLTTVVQNTDSDGRALVTLTLGPQAGINSNLVSATFTGKIYAPATFAATALTPGDPAQTKVSGVVLDNANTPLPGVTLRLYQPYLGQLNNVPLQVGPPVLTDAQGQFLMTNVPVGRFKLMVDPLTTTRQEFLLLGGKLNDINLEDVRPFLSVIGGIRDRFQFAPFGITVLFASHLMAVIDGFGGFNEPGFARLSWE